MNILKIKQKAISCLKKHKLSYNRVTVNSQTSSIGDFVEYKIYVFDAPQDSFVGYFYQKNYKDPDTLLKDFNEACDKQKKGISFTQN